jgi:hypothetical protein
MEKEPGTDKSSVSEVFGAHGLHVSLRISSVDPTERADLILVGVDNREGEPSEQADLKVRIIDTTVEEPSELAEVKISLVDGKGSIRVPGRFTDRLIDGCIAVGCTVAPTYTTKEVLDAAKDSLQGWMVLAVVTVQIAGIAVLAWRAMLRRRR